MKMIIIMLMATLCAQGTKAQTFAEWFEQNKTRVKYYEKQIAELEGYIGAAEKGYQIVEGGLSMIGQIKKGEFDLHNAFYSSLESVNPQVGGMEEVAGIIALQAAIIERFSRSLSAYRKSPWMNSSDISLIENIYSKLLSAGLEDINALTDLTTAGKLKMTDDQRMAGIVTVDASMRDKWGFTQSFTGETDLLLVQRQAEGSDIGKIQNLIK